MEIEAKYKALDEKFSGLLEANALGDYSLGNTEEQIINDRYMDTANYDILKAGYALRIREKNGRYLATVKGLGGSKGAIHQREEYEMEVKPDPKPQNWPDGEAKDIIISTIHSQPLKELFIIHQLRKTRPIHKDERLVGNMSLDIVDTELDKGTIRTYEVEIELEKDGILEDLNNLDYVVKSYGLLPETRSKFQRALEEAKDLLP